MKHKPSVAILFISALVATSCNNEVNLGSSFEELCLASGGELSTADALGQDVTGNYCKCPKRSDETDQEESFYICEEGIVCKPNESGDGFLCAGDGHEMLQTVECTRKDDKKCENGAIFICNGKEWIEDSKCAHGVSCRSNIDCGECLNGSMTCKDQDENAVLKTCIDGTWSEDQNTCSNSCNADKTGCGECTNGTQKCERDKIYYCTNGSWGIGSPCTHAETDTPSSCMDNNEECGECLNSDTQCVDGQYKVCTNGTWKSTPASCGECQEDEQVCINEPRFVNGAKQTVGVLKRCVDKEFIPEEYCNNNDLCIENACPPECQPGTFKCQDNTPYDCIDNHWAAREQCISSATCTLTPNGAQCQKHATCEEGTKRCTNGHIETCSNNKWDNIKPEPCNTGCDVTASASKDLKCFDCKNGTTKCENDQVRTCINNKWGPPTNCPMGTCEDNACPKCQNGKTSCKENKLTICSNEQWGTPVACGPDNKSEIWSCKSDTECGVCKNNDRRQKDDFLGLKTFVTCKNGVYSSNIEYCRYGEKDYKTCHPYKVHVRMIKTDLNIRTTPGVLTSSTFISTFGRGEEAVVYGQTTTDEKYLWYLIKFKNRAAWISSTEKLPADYAVESNTGTTTYQGDLKEYKKNRFEKKIRVNTTWDGYTSVRCHPSAARDDTIIGQYHPGDELNTYGHNTYWYEILYDGQIGWISKSLTTPIQ